MSCATSWGRPAFCAIHLNDWACAGLRFGFAFLPMPPSQPCQRRLPRAARPEGWLGRGAPAAGAPGASRWRVGRQGRLGCGNIRKGGQPGLHQQAEKEQNDEKSR